MLVARAHAVLRRRDYVTPEDVKAVAVAVLAHRLTLKPEMWMRRVAPEDVVREVLGEVPAPPTRRGRRGDRDRPGRTPARR